MATETLLNANDDNLREIKKLIKHLGEQGNIVLARFLAINRQYLFRVNDGEAINFSQKPVGLLQTLIKTFK